MGATQSFVYRISIEGRLDPAWSDRLAGMRIEEAASGALPVTVLFGRLADMSALHGVLHALLDLHLPILSMERLPETAREPKESARHGDVQRRDFER